MVAHLDERVHGSGLGGGMKSWRVQVRAGGACNAHAMSQCMGLNFLGDPVRRLASDMNLVRDVQHKAGVKL